MKVLHADTSSFFKRILGDLHHSEGVEYLTAGTGQEALDILEKNLDIRLIYTALELQDMSGSEFIVQAEALAPQIPIVVLTATDNMETRKAIFKLGVIDYIPKTTQADRLVSYIKLLYIDRFRKPDPLLENLRQMSIAIVEPEENSRYIIQNILRTSDVENIRFFASPDEILSGSDRYDMYLLDMTGPGYSPEQTIYEIRKKDGERSIIIILSSVDHNRTVSHILASGADDYIFKPFDASVFLATLKANSRFHHLLTELEKRNRELKELAIHDSLTGLFNHAHTYNLLRKELEKCNRYNRSLSILMMDLDHFKSVNDTYGHPVGDKVLSAVSRVIHNTLRTADIAGRYGGEEFLIILPETTKQEAINSAERIRARVEGLKYTVDGLKTTITIGVADYGESSSAVELIKIADGRLYAGKQQGRNRVNAED